MRYIPSRFGTGLGGAINRALLDLQHLIHTVHMANESIGNSVHVALDLGLASKAITAMWAQPTDRTEMHTGPCFPGGVFSVFRENFTFAYAL
jgi:hypothetical protein